MSFKRQRRNEAVNRNSLLHARKKRCKMRAQLSIIGYKVPPSILNPEGVPIFGMIARGARYPYSSVRQDERNRRRYADRIEGRSSST